MELIFYTLIPVSIFKHRNRVKSGKLRERAKWMHFVCCSLTSIGLVLIYWYWHTMHIRFTKEHKKIWNEVWLLNCIKNLRHKIIEIKICGKVKKLSHLKHSRAKFVNTVFFLLKWVKYVIIWALLWFNVI